jgi:hypothetical protein
MRLQNAVEFMITYGWAILVIILVIAALYSLGFFGSGSIAPSICALPANVGCVSAILIPNGLLTVNIQQATQYTINVVSIGCNDKGLTNNALMAMRGIVPNVTVGIGGNSTFTVLCYSNYKVYNAPIGSTYTGYLIVNYTDLSTGFQHTASGALVQKVQ